MLYFDPATSTFPLINSSHLEERSKHLIATATKNLFFLFEKVFSFAQTLTQNAHTYSLIPKLSLLGITTMALGTSFKVLTVSLFILIGLICQSNKERQDIFERDALEKQQSQALRIESLTQENETLKTSLIETQETFHRTEGHCLQLNLMLKDLKTTLKDQKQEVIEQISHLVEESLKNHPLLAEEYCSMRSIDSASLARTFSLLEKVHTITSQTQEDVSAIKKSLTAK